MDSERTRKLLIRHEGTDAHAYKDSRGILTIGVGRNVQKNSGPGLREEEIEYMLQCDLASHHRELEAHIACYRALDDVRQAVLLDMRHNLGLTGLLAFKNMLKALAAGDYQEAASEMLRSVWSIQVKQRAQRLARMMNSGQWPDQH